VPDLQNADDVRFVPTADILRCSKQRRCFDAQKVVSVINRDKLKTEAFCQMRTLGEQIDQAAEDKDTNNSEALIQNINGFERQLGPEYLALIDALNEAHPNSKDVQAILSMFDRLDEESCTH
jgi:hypothetical protein